MPHVIISINIFLKIIIVAAIFFYHSLPERLKILIEILIEKDPEWWKTLDAGLAEIERRHKKEGD